MKKPSKKATVKKSIPAKKSAVKKPKQIKASGKTTSSNGVVVVSHEKEAPEKTVEQDKSPVAKPFKLTTKKGKFVREDDPTNDTMVKMEDYKGDKDLN